jgi:hypothetical protein
MATALAEYDFSTPSISTKERRFYPWNTWFDGQIWRLTPGDDFSTSPLMMERVIRGTAVRRGLSVKVRHEEDGSVVLQASER